MQYGMVHCDNAPTAPDMPGVLGYLFNHGGLNNQKMALLALMLSGIKAGQAVNLPYIYNRDQRTSEEFLVEIKEIFDVDRIGNFANRHGLTVRKECPSGIRGGWDYFEAFRPMLLEAPNRTAMETILDAVTSLRPHIVSNPHFLQMKNFLRASLGIDTVVQLRIEADWREHAAHLRKNGNGDENGLGFTEILSKVKTTFPDLRMVYATADEKSLPAPKDEIRTVSRERFDIELFWKSDLINASAIDQFTPLDLSIIDYEIAKISPRFIGLTTSTFSNMLGIEKFALTRQPVRGHYIYNCLGELLQERKDNGFTTAAVLAVQPTRADALYQSAMNPSIKGISTI